LPPHPIGRLRFGDRNGSPTWLLDAELRSYAGTVSSGSFFAWQACSSRLKASCFQTISTGISIFGRRKRTRMRPRALARLVCAARDRKDGRVRTVGLLESPRRSVAPSLRLHGSSRVPGQPGNYFPGQKSASRKSHWPIDHVPLGNNSAARAESLFTKQSVTRFLFALLTVDDFVTVRTPAFNTDQQFSTRGVQQVQHQSITNYKFQ